MTVEDAAAVAEVVLAALALLAFLVSIWLSVKALREVQLDRSLRQAPYLVFESGGWRLPVEFVKAGPAIPGINPEAAAVIFAGLPEDAESVRINRDFGVLKNLGAGPALETEITWIPQVLRIRNERFVVDAAKLMEPPYRPDLNTMPALTRHIPPNGTATLSRIPTFIEKDIDKKLTKVDGVIEMSCVDIYRVRHVFRQAFLALTGYKDPKPWIHFTFSDQIEPAEH